MRETKTAIATFMTETPHGIDPGETLATAKQRMDDYKIRHLPVRTGGRVVGVLTDRDLAVLAAFPEVDFKKSKVGLAMTPDPYSVAPTTPLADVAREMEQRRIGCALVVDQADRLLGIFTDTDALRILSQSLGKVTP